jgi:hypothetical protein
MPEAGAAATNLNTGFSIHPFAITPATSAKADTVNAPAKHLAMRCRAVVRRSARSKYSSTGGDVGCGA